MSAGRSSRWIAGLALAAASACGGPPAPAEQAQPGPAPAKAEPAPAKAEPAQAKAEPAPPETTGPAWEGLRLEVVGAGRLSQGDQPPQEVLDQRQATVEGALDPIRRCLLDSEAARSARPPKLEFMFAAKEGQTRATTTVTGVIDDALSTCLRAAVGDSAAPTPDERLVVDVAVLVKVDVPG